MNKNLVSWYQGFGANSFYANFKRSPGGFIASGAGIIKGLVPEASDVKIRFTEDVGTAACLPTTPKTILLAKYLSEVDDDESSKIPEGLDTGDVYDRVSAALGAIVHEAMHIKYSPDDIKSAIDMTKEFFTLKKVGKTSLIKALINIVEDVYIENKAVVHFNQIAWMIEAAWDFWLPSEGSWDGELPKTKEELVAAINWIISAKNPKNLNPTTPAKAKIFELLEDAKYCDWIHDRVAVAISIEDLLISEIEDLDDLESGENDDSSEGSEGEGNSNSSDDFFGTFGQVDKELVEKIIKEYQDVLDGKKEYHDHYLDVLSQPGFVSTESDKNIEYVDALYFPREHEWKPDVDERWGRLEQIAYALSTGKPVDYIKTKRGSKLGDLSRIATDGKVFNRQIGNSSKPGRTSMPSTKEFIILVDCSGSMMSYGKINRAFSAVVGAVSAIKKSRHQVSAYGFTGDCSYGQSKFRDSVIIFPLIVEKEPLSVMDQRISNIYTNELMFNNYDGYSIQAVGKEFKGNGKKYLIVISDGQPAGRDYSGMQAVEHTQREVLKLKKRGVNVICISIDKHAIASNDIIYGRDFNIHNDDPNAIDKVIEQLI